jgi:hypothetical protein
MILDELVQNELFLVFLGKKESIAMIGRKY